MAARSAPAKTGNGATITFSDEPFNSFSGTITRIDGLSQALEALDWSDLSTTTQQKLIAADLTTFEPFEIEWRWDANEYANIDLDGASIDFVITMPLWAGASGSGGTIQGSAIAVGRTMPTLENNVVGVGTISMQPDGITAITVTAEQS